MGKEAPEIARSGRSRGLGVYFADRAASGVSGGAELRPRARIPGGGQRHEQPRPGSPAVPRVQWGRT